LVLLDDQRLFLKLRLDTGELTWQHASQAASLRPLNAATFGVHFLPVGKRLLVQNASGQPWWLGLQSGPAGAPSRPWLQPPLLVGNRIVTGGEKGRILAHDLANPHDLRWTYQAPWPTSLSGELCRLFSNGSVLLALVPRNDGLEWVSVDPLNGQQLWTVHAHRLPNEPDLGSVCIGTLSYYYVYERTLYARSLSDGALQWQQRLPGLGSRWRVRYARSYLTVYPAETDKDFFVGFLDPSDGRWQERLSFPPGRGAAEIVQQPDVLVVSFGGKICGFRRLELNSP
jgi:hypothetical protein